MDEVGNMALYIFPEADPSGEVLLKLTVNTENTFDSDLFVAKTYAENAPYRDELLQSGYFRDMGARIKLSKFVQGEIWQLIKRD